jgi:hypothetical protein
VRAEFGTPHEIVFVKPGDMLVTLMGTQALGTQNLVGMQAMYWFNRGYRCHPMPNFLESFKIAEGREQAMPFARLVTALALACVVSLVATYAANYIITYEAGAAGKASAGYKRWVGGEAFGQLANWLKFGQPAGAANLWFFVGGLASVGALAALRASFLWWPLHPAGFALGISYAMNYFWLCVFVAWLAKLFIIRYGGMTAHRRAIPFFWASSWATIPSARSGPSSPFCSASRPTRSTFDRLHAGAERCLTIRASKNNRPPTLMGAAGGAGVSIIAQCFFAGGRVQQLLDNIVLVRLDGIGRQAEARGDVRPVAGQVAAQTDERQVLWPWLRASRRTGADRPRCRA